MNNPTISDPECTPVTYSKRVDPYAIRWERTDPSHRLAAAYEVLHQNDGLTFTLRLELDVAICVSGSDTPARTMSRRIHRAFKRAGIAAPDFAFALKVTPDHREELHLHGAINIVNLDPACVKSILRKACGVIPGHAGSRQAQLKGFDLGRGGPAGWARYSMKDASRTRRVIGHDKLVYISSDLRKHAQDHWDAHRAQGHAGSHASSRQLN